MMWPSCILDTARTASLTTRHDQPSPRPHGHVPRWPHAVPEAHSMTPLPAIRLAMLGGVLLFGAVSWFLTHTDDWTAPEPGVAGQLISIARIVWVVVGVTLTILFLRFRDSTNAA